jgi:hypothetical protein
MNVRLSSWAAATTLLVAVAFFAGAATRGQDSDNAAKEKKVRKLLELNGSTDLANSQFEEMCKKFSENPQIPQGFEKKFRELAKPSDLIEIIVPVYMKHLDDELLDGLVEFFGSPNGKKFASVQPGIMKDSQQAGMKWGTKMALKVINELQGGAPDKGDKGDKGKGGDKEDE